MIKLIASDMDGTLLNDKRLISKENVQAIKKAQSKGIKFLIATGRNYEEVEGFLLEHDIRCKCILMNGSEYRDENGKIFETINIDKNKVKKITILLQKSAINLRLMTNKGIFTTNTKEEDFMFFVSMYKRDKSISEEKAIEIVKKSDYFVKTKYIENIDELLEENIEIRKIIANFDIKETAEVAKVELNKFDGLAIAASFFDNIEITDIKAQKGIMLSKVAEDLKLSKDEVMVIGDSFNDYSMFTEFNESVAMGNAIDEIKAIAKYVTETNEDNGVGKAITRVCLIEK